MANCAKSQCSLIGIEPSDLSEQSSRLLEKYVSIQRITQLHKDFDLNNLKEIGFLNRKVNLEQKLITGKILSTIECLETQLLKEKQQVNELKEFIAKNELNHKHIEHLDTSIGVMHVSLAESQSRNQKLLQNLKMQPDQIVAKYELLEKQKGSKLSRRSDIG